MDKYVLYILERLIQNVEISDKLVLPWDFYFNYIIYKKPDVFSQNMLKTTSFSETPETNPRTSSYTLSKVFLN